MEYIIDPTEPYDYSQLRMVSPTNLGSGTYFIRLLTNKQNPIYIQTPKCTTKAGVIRSAKKMYTDLLFSHETEYFFDFMEKIEEHCKQELYDNKEKWFDSDLTTEDIENSFIPLLKSFRSGKFFSVRVNLPLRLGKCVLKIYDEQESVLPIEQINDKVKLITIMELQGIRCTSRNFQFDIELKQAMIMNDVDIFSKCVLPSTQLLKEIEEEPDNEISILPEASKSDIDLGKEEQNIDTIISLPIEEPSESKLIEDPDENEDEDEVFIDNLEKTTEDDNIDKDLEEIILEDLEKTKEEDNDESLEEMCEVNFDTKENLEEVTLKNRNDVYYEMYKEAKKKARIARDLALTSYLQAKQIKTNYLVEDSSDDDNMENEEDELDKLELIE